MNVLDLFSGIGGFSLGLERAGMRTVAFCEIDPYCRAVLAKHWPNVPIWGDVRTLTAKWVVANANGDSGKGRGKSLGEPASEGTQHSPAVLERGRVDVICGGFPCQDISTAGKGAGINGGRSGLWTEYARIIGELRPRFVIVENVAALLGRGLDRVLGDLASLGYDAEWHCIPACAVGAPHRRDRIWIVGHAPGAGYKTQWPSSVRSNEGLAGGTGSGLADPDIPRLPIGEMLAGICREEEWADARKDTGVDGSIPDTYSQSALRSTEPRRQRGHWLVEPDVGRVVARLSSRLDGVGLEHADAINGAAGQILRALRDGIRTPTLQWEIGGRRGIPAAEVLFSAVCEYTGPPRPLGNLSLAGTETSPPAMRGLWFDGTIACPSCRRAAREQRPIEHSDALRLLPQLLACGCGSAWLDPTGSTGTVRRVDRLRSLGNAVVPQIPEVIGRAIMRAQ